MIAEFLTKQSPKCNPVKNACKICLEQVTNKNGLQCQGACKKWAHYKCLRYTPGKISDIKAGILKVLCPCPDCQTTQEKEYLTNPPYTCSNEDCPGNARGPVKCTSAKCPHNTKKKIENWCSPKACADDSLDSPTQTKDPYLDRLTDDCLDKNNQPSTCLSEDAIDSPTRTKQPPRRKTYAAHPGEPAQEFPNQTKHPPSRRSAAKPSEHALDRPTQTKSPKLYAALEAPTQAKSPQHAPIPKKKAKGHKEAIVATHTNNNDSCDDLECPKHILIEGEDKDQMKNALKEMCGTVKELSKQIKELMCKIKMMEGQQG